MALNKSYPAVTMAVRMRKAMGPNFRPGCDRGLRCCRNVHEALIAETESLAKLFETRRWVSLETDTETSSLQMTVYKLTGPLA